MSLPAIRSSGEGDSALVGLVQRGAEATRLYMPVFVFEQSYDEDVTMTLRSTGLGSLEYLIAISVITL